MNLEPLQSQLPPLSPEGGNAGVLGMPADHRRAIDAMDVALARQQIPAAANASNPFARAIILHLAALVAGGNAPSRCPASVSMRWSGAAGRRRTCTRSRRNAEAQRGLDLL